MKETNETTVPESDVEMVQAVGAGERSARRRLLYRVMPRVEKTVHALSKGHCDAEDLMQLALIEIVRAAPTYRGESSLDYWTDRVVVQTLAKQFQKRHRRDEIRNRFFDPPLIVLSIEDQVAAKELRDRLILILRKLKDPIRVPLALHYLQGYDVAEIAELMDLKFNTVRGRLRKGAAKVRKLVLADPALREWVGSGLI